MESLFIKNNVMWLNVNKIFLKRYIVGLWSHFLVCILVMIACKFNYVFLYVY